MSIRNPIPRADLLHCTPPNSQLRTPYSTRTLPSLEMITFRRALPRVIV